MGRVIVKNTAVTKETTYAFTLQAFVDGQVTQSNFDVTVTPKPDPLSMYFITEPKPDLTTESVAEELVAAEDGDQSQDKAPQMEENEAMQTVTQEKKQEAID
jgi:hypothetical protein